MTEKTPGSRNASVAGDERTSVPEHDQDSDPPRTAIPPDSTKRPGAPTGPGDPDHDQDSDPPRTAVPPKG